MIGEVSATKQLVAYTRRSTDKQSASPHVQEREIREWCKSQGHQLVRVCHEVAITGKTEVERRTVLPGLISEVKNRKGRDFDGIVVWKFDRLCRNTAEYHRIMGILDKHRCEIFSLKDPAYGRKTAADRVVTNILADFAAYEREVTGERIYAHNLARVLSGRWPGGKTPVGFDYDKETGKFSLNDRSPHILRVFELYVETSGNASETARRLQAEGIPGPLNPYWGQSSVLGILRRRIYRRELIYSGHSVDVSGIVPEIVPPNLIAMADSLMVDTREFRPRQRASDRTYSGILQCAVCGSAMVGSLRRTKRPAGVYAYRGWMCRLARTYDACDSREVSERHIDKMVGEALKLLLSEYKAEIEEQQNSRKVAKRSTRTPALPDIKTMRKNLINLYMHQRITEEEFVEQSEALGKLQERANHPVAITPKIKEVDEAVNLISDEWKDIPPEIKRKLLLSLGVRITVGNHQGSSPSIKLTSNLTLDTYIAESTLNNYRDIASVCVYRQS